MTDAHTASNNTGGDAANVCTGTTEHRFHRTTRFGTLVADFIATHRDSGSGAVGTAVSTVVDRNSHCIAVDARRLAPVAFFSRPGVHHRATRILQVLSLLASPEMTYFSAWGVLTAPLMVVLLGSEAPEQGTSPDATSMATEARVVACGLELIHRLRECAPNDPERVMAFLNDSVGGMLRRQDAKVAAALRAASMLVPSLAIAVIGMLTRAFGRDGIAPDGTGDVLTMWDVLLADDCLSHALCCAVVAIPICLRREVLRASTSADMEDALTAVVPALTGTDARCTCDMLLDIASLLQRAEPSGQVDDVWHRLEWRGAPPFHALVASRGGREVKAKLPKDGERPWWKLFS